MYALFRDGYPPKWEAEQCRKGGRWTLILRKTPSMNKLWESALLALIGDPYQIGDSLIGVMLSRRSNGFAALSFWVKDANDAESTIRVREALKSLMDIPINRAFEFQAHEARVESASHTADVDASGDVDREEEQ